MKLVKLTMPHGIYLKGTLLILRRRNEFRYDILDTNLMTIDGLTNCLIDGGLQSLFMEFIVDISDEALKSKLFKLVI